MLWNALFEESALPGRVGLLPSTLDIEWVEPPIFPRAPLAVAGLAGNGGGWELDELENIRYEQILSSLTWIPFLIGISQEKLVIAH